MVRATSPGHHLRDSWRARCRETGTPGSGERPGETPAGNGGTAPLADSYNSSHWIRDVTFGEDARTIRTRNTPAVVATLSDIVRGTLRAAGWTNTASARRARTDPDHILKLHGIP